MEIWLGDDIERACRSVLNSISEKEQDLALDQVVVEEDPVGLHSNEGEVLQMRMMINRHYNTKIHERATIGMPRKLSQLKIAY